MKGLSENGKVLVYGMNESLERTDLTPTAIIERDGVKYVIVDNEGSKALCYPCEQVPYTGDPSKYIDSMVSFIEPEAEEYLKNSGKLVEIELE